MTKEEKQILLKDLCARLLYGLTFQSYHSECWIEGKGTFDFKIGDDATLDTLRFLCESDNNKPYLRSMSNMTEEEEREFEETLQYTQYTLESYDWLNARHFDYRGLIEKGLALEAPKDMYKNDSVWNSVRQKR